MKKILGILFAVIVVAAATHAFLQTRKKELPPETARLVRTITASKSVASNPISLTGEIRAENEANIGFRVEGKMIERIVSLGDTVHSGQIIARLDPQDMTNNLVAARADLAKAQASLTEAISAEYRQRMLSAQGYSPKRRHEETQRALGVAQAQVTSAKAHVKLAEDQLAYTTLKSDVAGAVTETLSEAGEVLRAGQAVFRIAQDGGRDAVFSVPENLIYGARKDKGDLKIDIALSNDPDFHVEGRIREVSPQADPVTRTFTVKVGLIDPPRELRLGSVVTGRVAFNTKASMIRIPAMALNRHGDSPAVWIVDPGTMLVSLRNIKVEFYDQDSVVVTEGIEDGDIIVIAGVQSLHPGQKVRIEDRGPEVSLR